MPTNKMYSYQGNNSQNYNYQNPNGTSFGNLGQYTGPYHPYYSNATAAYSTFPSNDQPCSSLGVLPQEYSQVGNGMPRPYFYDANSSYSRAYQGFSFNQPVEIPIASSYNTCPRNCHCCESLKPKYFTNNAIRQPASSESPCSSAISSAYNGLRKGFDPGLWRDCGSQLPNIHESNDSAPSWPLQKYGNSYKNESCPWPLPQRQPGKLEDGEHLPSSGSSPYVLSQPHQRKPLPSGQSYTSIHPNSVMPLQNTRPPPGRNEDILGNCRVGYQYNSYSDLPKTDPKSRQGESSTQNLPRQTRNIPANCGGGFPYRFSSNTTKGIPESQKCTVEPPKGMGPFPSTLVDSLQRHIPSNIIVDGSNKESPYCQPGIIPSVRSVDSQPRTYNFSSEGDSKFLMNCNSPVSSDLVQNPKPQLPPIQSFKPAGLLSRNPSKEFNPDYSYVPPKGVYKNPHLNEIGIYDSGCYPQSPEVPVRNFSVINSERYPRSISSESVYKTSPGNENNNNLKRCIPNSRQEVETQKIKLSCSEIVGTDIKNESGVNVPAKNLSGSSSPVIGDLRHFLSTWDDGDEDETQNVVELITTNTKNFVEEIEAPVECETRESHDHMKFSLDDPKSPTMLDFEMQGKADSKSDEEFVVELRNSAFESQSYVNSDILNDAEKIATELNITQDSQKELEINDVNVSQRASQEKLVSQNKISSNISCDHEVSGQVEVYGDGYSSVKNGILDDGDPLGILNSLGSGSAEEKALDDHGRIEAEKIFDSPGTLSLDDVSINATTSNSCTNESKAEYSEGEVHVDERDAGIPEDIDTVAQNSSCTDEKLIEKGNFEPKSEVHVDERNASIPEDVDVVAQKLIGKGNIESKVTSNENMQVIATEGSTLEFSNLSDPEKVCLDSSIKVNGILENSSSNPPSTPQRDFKESFTENEVSNGAHRCINESENTNVNEKESSVKECIPTKRVEKEGEVDLHSVGLKADQDHQTTKDTYADIVEETPCRKKSSPLSKKKRLNRKCLGKYPEDSASKLEKTNQVGKGQSNSLTKYQKNISDLKHSNIISSYPFKLDNEEINRNESDDTSERTVNEGNLILESEENALYVKGSANSSVKSEDKFREKVKEFVSVKSPSNSAESTSELKVLSSKKSFRDGSFNIVTKVFKKSPIKAIRKKYLTLELRNKIRVRVGTGSEVSNWRFVKRGSEVKSKTLNIISNKSRPFKKRKIHKKFVKNLADANEPHSTDTCLVDDVAQFYLVSKEKDNESGQLLEKSGLMRDENDHQAGDKLCSEKNSSDYLDSTQNLADSGKNETESSLFTEEEREINMENFDGNCVIGNVEVFMGMVEEGSSVEEESKEVKCDCEIPVEGGLLSEETMEVQYWSSFEFGNALGVAMEVEVGSEIDCDDNLKPAKKENVATLESNEDSVIFEDGVPKEDVKEPIAENGTLPEIDSGNLNIDPSENKLLILDEKHKNDCVSEDVEIQPDSVIRDEKDGNFGDSGVATETCLIQLGDNDSFNDTDLDECVKSEKKNLKEEVEDANPPSVDSVSAGNSCTYKNSDTEIMLQETSHLKSKTCSTASKLKKSLKPVNKSKKYLKNNANLGPVSMSSECSSLRLLHTSDNAKNSNPRLPEKSCNSHMNSSFNTKEVNHSENDSDSFAVQHQNAENVKEVKKACQKINPEIEDTQMKNSKNNEQFDSVNSSSVTLEAKTLKEKEKSQKEKRCKFHTKASLKYSDKEQFDSLKSSSNGFWRNRTWPFNKKYRRYSKHKLSIKNLSNSNQAAHSPSSHTQFDSVLPHILESYLPPPSPLSPISVLNDPIPPISYFSDISSSNTSEFPETLNSIDLSSPTNTPDPATSPIHNSVAISSPTHNPLPFSSPTHNFAPGSSPNHNFIPLSSPSHNSILVSSPTHNSVPVSSPTHQCTDDIVKITSNTTGQNIKEEGDVEVVNHPKDLSQSKNFPDVDIFPNPSSREELLPKSEDTPVLSESKLEIKTECEDVAGKELSEVESTQVFHSDSYQLKEEHSSLSNCSLVSTTQDSSNFMCSSHSSPPPRVCITFKKVGIGNRKEKWIKSKSQDGLSNKPDDISRTEVKRKRVQSSSGHESPLPKVTIKKKMGEKGYQSFLSGFSSSSPSPSSSPVTALSYMSSTFKIESSSFEINDVDHKENEIVESIILESPQEVSSPKPDLNSVSSTGETNSKNDNFIPEIPEKISEVEAMSDLNENMVEKKEGSGLVFVFRGLGSKMKGPRDSSSDQQNLSSDRTQPTENSDKSEDNSECSISSGDDGWSSGPWSVWQPVVKLSRSCKLDALALKLQTGSDVDERKKQSEFRNSWKLLRKKHKSAAKPTKPSHSQKQSNLKPSPEDKLKIRNSISSDKKENDGVKKKEVCELKNKKSSHSEKTEKDGQKCNSLKTEDKSSQLSNEERKRKPSLLSLSLVKEDTSKKKVDDRVCNDTEGKIKKTEFQNLADSINKSCEKPVKQGKLSSEGQSNSEEKSSRKDKYSEKTHSKEKVSLETNEGSTKERLMVRDNQTKKRVENDGKIRPKPETSTDESGVSSKKEECNKNKEFISQKNTKVSLKCKNTTLKSLPFERKVDLNSAKRGKEVQKASFFAQKIQRRSSEEGKPIFKNSYASKKRNPYYCETCSRNFTSQKWLNRHCKGVSHSRVENAQRLAVQALLLLLTGGESKLLQPLTEKEFSHLRNWSSHAAPSPLQLALKEFLQSS